MATVPDAVWARYTELRDKLNDHAWPDYEAFVSETQKAYGEESLEHAHALAIFARKSRWEGDRVADGLAKVEHACAIGARTGALPDRLGFWWQLVGLLRLISGNTPGAIDAAQASWDSWRQSSNVSPRYVASREGFGIVFRMALPGAPLTHGLRALLQGWPKWDDPTRDELAGLVKEIRAFRPDLTDDQRAALHEITADPATMEAAIKLLPAEPGVSDEVALAAALRDLDALIGLDAAKAEVRRLVALLRVRQMRAAAGLTVPETANHFAFLGPPGTGKTTVARLLGRIFKALGLLATDNVVEVDRAGLIAEYVGQTAPKVDAAFTRAIDGILFIDEAYALFQDRTPIDYRP